MAVKFCVGNILVSPEEYHEKITSRKINRFMIESNTAIELSGRKLTSEHLFAARGALDGILKKQFEPIGLGKPLSIQLYTIYTGDVPKNFFGGLPGLLVSSAVKTDIGNTEAKPRAINMLFETVKDGQYISNSAMTVGTPIVYYTQSVVNESIMVSFEFALDQLKRKDIDQLTGLFGTAAGIPIFAPAATYLLAGGTIVGILKCLVDIFMPGKAFLHDDVTLRLNDPLFDPFTADALALFRDEDKDEFANCERQVVKEGPGKEYLALVDSQTGKTYSGKAPYIMAVFDGRDRSKDLKDFMPTLVSAAILEQFYGGKPSEQAVNAVKEAMALYNDLTYSRKAEDLKTQLAKAGQGSKVYKELKSQFDAYNSGIQNEKFKVIL